MAYASHKMLTNNLRGKFKEGQYRYMPKETAYKLLKQQTGQDFGYDADAWDEWIEDSLNPYSKYKTNPYRDQSKQLERITSAFFDEPILAILRILNRPPNDSESSMDAEQKEGKMELSKRIRQYAQQYLVTKSQEDQVEISLEDLIKAMYDQVLIQANKLLEGE